MLERGKMDRTTIEFVDTEGLVPQDHLLRKIDAAVDFSKIYEMVEPLYCTDNGRPSIVPVVLFKMVLIQHLYGLNSLRRTASEVSVNIAYRWFLGYRLTEETPHFSTLSYNFRHRFTAETVDAIFAWILEEIAEAGYLSPEAVFIDGTHIKARANDKKVRETIDFLLNREEAHNAMFREAFNKVQNSGSNQDFGTTKAAKMYFSMSEPSPNNNPFSETKVTPSSFS